MGVETNAILAINSLDRYNTSKISNPYQFDGIWNGNGVTVLNYIPGAPNTVVPVVGSVFVGGNIGTVGIQPGTVITAVNPGVLQFTIDKPTTTIGQVQGRFFFDSITTTTFPSFNNGLNQLYYNNEPYANSFTIESSGSLIYGYITKIIVAQVQLQYNVPTVIKDKNDLFYISVSDAPGPNILYPITIPHGFYYPDELAATLQSLLRAADAVRFSSIFVIFYPRTGFIFNNAVANRTISFPNITLLQVGFYGPTLTPVQFANVLKTYRLLGITLNNIGGNLIQSTEYPNFLYTPYVDILSDVLTNYQKIKDTNSSIIAPKGLVARLYFSGVGSPQTTGSFSALGTAPFVMTADLNFPKVITWTPEQTVTSIDFQLRDCYGDLLPGYKEGYSTEFQMTLLCTEGDT